MGWFGLALLAVAWLVILAPALRPQRRGSPRFTAHSFRRTMGILADNRSGRRRSPTRGGANGRFVLVPDDAERIAGSRRGAPHRPARPTRRPHAHRRTSAPPTPANRAVRRRLAVLRTLLAAVVVSALAWIGVDAVGAWPFGAAVAALVGYCALLAGRAPARGRGHRPGGRGRTDAVRPAGSRVPSEPRATREIVLDDERVAHGA